MHQVTPGWNKHYVLWNITPSVLSNAVGTQCVFSTRGLSLLWEQSSFCPLVSLLFVPHPWLHLFFSKYESSCKHPFSSLQDLLLSFHQNNDEKVRLQTEEGVINSLMAQRTYSIFAAGKWWVSCLIKYFSFIITVKGLYLIRTIAFQW